jgi:hypothetical protein
MASRKVERLTLEQIRAGGPGLTQADLIRASQGLLATLRRNRDTIAAEVTPGTTAEARLQERIKVRRLRVEGRAFWVR